MEARSLINRLDGWREVQENNYKAGMIQARLTATLIVANLIGKKGQRIKPSDLMVFPWEEDSRNELPKELIDAVFSRWDEQLKQQ